VETHRSLELIFLATLGNGNATSIEVGLEAALAPGIDSGIEGIEPSTERLQWPLRTGYQLQL